MTVLKRLFTWWNGYTVGTWLFTRRSGQFVGEDERGNRYYQTTGGARRWVLFNGVAEASKVSADWHGWLHHTYDAPPTESPLPRRAWEKDHLPNLTGTEDAYRPKGSLNAAKRPAEAAGYSAWRPAE